MTINRQTRRSESLGEGHPTSPLGITVPSRNEESILRALLAQPFFPMAQLRKLLGVNPLTWNKSMSRLQASGLIRKHNAHYPGLDGQWVLTLTREGLEFLAARDGFDLATFLNRHSYGRGRLAWLAAVLERVLISRIFFQWLETYERRLDEAAHERAKETNDEQPWEWKMLRWDVEIELEYRRTGRRGRIPFSGAAIFEHRLTRAWSWLVLEMDRGQVAVEAEYKRLTDLIAAQSDPGFGRQAGQKPFPVLAILAADEYRLNEYELLIRKASSAQRLSVPSIYITTVDLIVGARRNPRAPVWYSTKLNIWTSLLSAEQGSQFQYEESLWERRAWGKPSGSQQVLGIGELQKTKAVGGTIREMAVLSLGLASIEKELMALIGAHPLLSVEELVILSGYNKSEVYRATSNLAKMRLIRPLKSPADQDWRLEPASRQVDARARQARSRTNVFVLGEMGERYMTATAGFGTALEKYRRARGWSENYLVALLKNWRHTRLENLLYLKLAQAARQQNCQLKWLSESESRLYFKLGGKLYYFLPDSRGTLTTLDGGRLHFAVEIDSGRSGLGKIRRKLTQYYACLSSNALRVEGVEQLRVLFVTHSPTRADHLWTVVRELAQETQSDELHLSSDRLMPVFIAQINALISPSSDFSGPIWLDARHERRKRIDTRGLEREETAAEAAKSHCFDCFIPGPPAPDNPEGWPSDRTRTGQVVYKS